MRVMSVPYAKAWAAFRYLAVERGLAAWLADLRYAHRTAERVHVTQVEEG
jgi:hypothetical protein